MEGLFVIFILFVIFQGMRSSAKKAKVNTKKPPQTTRGAVQKSYETNPELRKFKARLNTIVGDGAQRNHSQVKTQRQKDYEARRAKVEKGARDRDREHVPHGRHGLVTEKRDKNDKNRHRIADWGERAGPGLITAKSLTALLALGVIGLYVMSQLGSA